jgi:hypothetical protein
MENLPGYTVKPYTITPTGAVFFTDGTNNNLMANQVTCEAYGYKYNTETGTCGAYMYSDTLEQNLRNFTNKNNGSGNITEGGTNTVQINGTYNKTKGINSNCFINGSGNVIANGVNNATVLGQGGIANSNGEMVIGGGLNAIGETASPSYADRKMSIVALSGVTTDNSTVNLTVNGDGSSFIGVKNNSILGFEMYITRLETGGFQ